MLPGGTATSASRPEPSTAHSDSRSVASTACTASSCRSPAGPSTRATSDRTAVADSGTTVVQAVGSQVAGSAGSATATRPRGASRSENSHSRPSRATQALVCASTPTCSGASRPSPCQVGQPDVVAGRGARRGRDDQPAAVPGQPDAVVVGRVQPVPVHQDVGGRVGADPVPEDPPVELLLPGRDLVRGQPAHVVQLLATGQPGDGGVAAAVDRTVEQLAGGHVEHEQLRLLVAAHRHLVGDPVALPGRRPRVEGGGARRVQRHRVDQHPLGAVEVADAQHGVLLAGVPPGGERPTGPPDRDADRAGTHQLAQPVGEGRAVGEGAQQLGGVVVLRGRPRRRPRVGRVLQPPVGVGDGVPVQVLDEVEAGGEADGVRVARGHLPTVTRTYDTPLPPVGASGAGWGCPWVAAPRRSGAHGGAPCR